MGARSASWASSTARSPSRPSGIAPSRAARRISLYLPFAEHERLLARPESPISDGPEGPRYADMLASRTTSVAFWIDLPTPALREAYARYLATALGARGVRYELRDLALLRHALGLPKSALNFFVFLTFLVLAGAGLVASRLYLAKGLTRQGELSIFRAVGAPRLSLVVRQLLEAMLLSALAGVSATAVAAASAFVYNRLVADTDIPLAVTPLAFALMFTATMVVGTAAALYPAWRAAARRPTLTRMLTCASTPAQCCARSGGSRPSSPCSCSRSPRASRRSRRSCSRPRGTGSSARSTAASTRRTCCSSRATRPAATRRRSSRASARTSRGCAPSPASRRPRA